MKTLNENACCENFDFSFGVDFYFKNVEVMTSKQDFNNKKRRLYVIFRFLKY